MNPLQLLTRVRAKNPAPSAAAPTPAKRTRKRVTAAALESAIAACRAELDPSCATVQTLEQLYALIDDGVVRHGGAAPVTLAELDAALSEVRDLNLPKALRTLKAVGEQLAHAAEQAQAATVAEGAEPLFITRKQLDAALDAMGAVVGAAAECFSDTHFIKGNLIGDLSRIAGDASGQMAPYVKRLVRAVCAYEPPKRIPESQEDRLYRNNHGRARPR
jgi:ABC-type transporter Mla subunit MlaD